MIGELTDTLDFAYWSDCERTEPLLFQILVCFFDPLVPQDCPDVFHGLVSAVKFADVNHGPVQQQLADPVGQFPHQGHAHHEVERDLVLRVIQPVVKRSFCGVQLRGDGFPGFAVLLHQHIEHRSSGL